MKSKSIYNPESINATIGLVITSLLMIGFSLYLTQHFFDVKFPTGLASSGLCNINSFFNCDKATNSSMSQIFSVPISIFGVIIGILALFGLMFKNEDYEKSIYFVLIINFLGCILLFLYSLIILHGLCPFCTLYYIASGILLYLFYKNSSDCKPVPGYLVSIGIVFLLAGFLTRQNVLDKEKTQTAVGADLIKQYYSLPNLGMPNYPSIYKLASLNDAPIKMAIFSDFECPSCKALSEEIPALLEKYKGKIDISYYFYPLDQSCNPNIKREMHRFACKAAYAAVCMPSTDFYQIHETIFKNQEKFESGFVDEYIKNNKLDQCVNSPETKDKVVKLIAAASSFNIESTPTFIINGVKIEGVLPLDQMQIIFDEILKRASK